MMMWQQDNWSVLVCARVLSQQCQSTNDLSRISRQGGGGQSSQKYGVARSGQRPWKVRVLSEYQRAPWELDIAKQGPEMLPGTD